MATGDKIQRKFLAHFIDSSFGGETPSYVRIGKDLEEYNVELNPDTETVKNILGENSTTVKGYEVSSSVDTHYAREGDALFTQLLTIINNRSTGSDLETTVIDVQLWDETETTGVFNAFKEDVIVIPQSLGGDTGGVQIPYQITYNGNRTAGTWTASTSTFTAAS